MKHYVTIPIGKTTAEVEFSYRPAQLPSDDDPGDPEYWEIHRIRVNSSWLPIEDLLEALEEDNLIDAISEVWRYERDVF